MAFSATTKPWDQAGVSADSGIGASLEESGFLYESTPKKLEDRTFSLLHFKKRDISESCPSSPAFCSTFNGEDSPSLEPKFKKINLEESLEPALKVFRDETGRPVPGHSSPPNTPEKAFLRKQIFGKIQSPLKETQDILYPSLKSRKVLSPKKQEKRPFGLKKNTSFCKVVRNNVVMANLFGFLSDGDLFRVSKASSLFLVAIEENMVAQKRLENFSERHKINKENYTITPPPSPQDYKLDFRSSTNNSDFHQIAQKLDHDQSLTKCLNCKNPMIVKLDLGQCERCGLTYCFKCGSQSNNPESFVNTCGNTRLLLENARSTLANLSNSPGIKQQQHQFNVSTVKRNLSQSFGDKQNILKNNNFVQNTKRAILKKRHSSILPVIKTERQMIENREPSSPPRIKDAAVCSKQSKRNLKRLTR